jgi:predicted ATP-dependent protease
VAAFDDVDAVRRQAGVPWTKARRQFHPDDFGPPPGDGTPRMVGQDRAVRAIDAGLRMRAHMFLVGPVGTGKTTYAVNRAREWAASQPTPHDYCYVPNLEHPEQPKVLTLPAGMGRRLRQDVETLVTTGRDQIREALESDAYAHHRQVLLHQFQDQIQAIWTEVVNQARLLGFAVEPAPTGTLLTIPLDPSGRPFRPEEFAQLPESLRNAFAERQRQLEEPLAQATRRVRMLQREQRQALLDDAQQVASTTLEHLLDPIRAAYTEVPAAAGYLQAVAQDMAEHVDVMAADDGEGAAAAIDWPARYRVHVLVEHEPGHGAPVVMETNPTYDNLFGRIDYQQVEGRLIPYIDGIRAGSLHRANGGYLIISAPDLMREPASYPALKRVLKQGWAPIENMPGPFWAPPALFRPEPVPLSVTVLLVGPAEVYYALYAYDDEFRRLFTVKADFAPDMPASPENLAALRELMNGVAEREGWPPVGETAMAALAAYGARLAEDQERIATRMGDMIAVLSEAAAYAHERQATVLEDVDVEEALNARRERAAGPEDLLNRMVEDGTLLIATQGKTVGQVNGLAVLSAGDQPFGRPSRITAVTHAGRQGVVAIERVTHQSGPSHTKGVMILSAFLASRFAQSAPLSLGASITFEQMYNEVDGDSASSAELYALLSALADLPIDQGIAVTGSVNQKGEIQPIGGVNQKVEGFYRVCETQGLTGGQGVLIPRRNVRHLMLDDKVVEAMRAGQFHLWAVDTVEEGIAILTGVPAGTPEDGPETVMGRVAARLKTYAAVLRAAQTNEDRKATT